MKIFASLLVALALQFVATAQPATTAVDAHNFFAKNTAKFVALGKWRNSYLVVDSVDSSTIYAMSSNGFVTIYNPYAVDANAYGCSGEEKRLGNWCVSRGRLFKYRNHIAVKSGGGLSELFYVNEAGKVCAYPDESLGYNGQCEDQGRVKALRKV